MFIICIVDDVSAQTNCIISPTNIATLTIHTGSRFVGFNCQCMNGDNIITGTSWFLGNTSVTAQGNTNYYYDDHYYNNITVGRLLLDRFNSGNSGRYTCSPNSISPTVPPGVTITLNVASESLAIYIYCIIMFFKIVSFHVSTVKN